MGDFNINHVERDCRDGGYIVEVGTKGVRRTYSVYFGKGDRSSNEIFYSIKRWLIRTPKSGTMRIPRPADLRRIGLTVCSPASGVEDTREVREALIATMCSDI